MTGRERVLAVLRREKPDRVPFCPNIGQWFDYHKARASLPDELEGCQDELDAMIRIGCDIFSRRICSPVTSARSGYEVHSEALGGRWRKTTYATPVGSVSDRTRYEAASHTTYKHQHFLKGFPDDLRVLRYVVEHTDHEFDVASYLRAEERLGDHGVIMVPFFQSPIKLLHNWAGVETATYLLTDRARECEDLFAVFTEKALAVARQAAESPTLAFCTMDNLDSLSMSPTFVKQYCVPFYRALSDLFHRHGKLLFSHACGQLRDLGELVDEAGLDGLEAISHPPIGDLPLAEARGIHDGFLVNGGMSAHETEITGAGSRERIFAYVGDLFRSMRPLDRFLFSNACNTSIRSPWENLLHFRDACHEHGRLGDDPAHA